MPVTREEAVVCYLHDLLLPALRILRHIAAKLMRQAVMVSL
jgi:hypothetical protein